MRHDPIAFGKAVAKKRRMLGLSLREIAEPLGMAYTTLHRIENGASCDVENFLILAEWLNQPVPELPSPCKRCHGSGLETKP